MVRLIATLRHTMRVDEWCLVRENRIRKTDLIRVQRGVSRSVLVAGHSGSYNRAYWQLLMSPR